MIFLVMLLVILLLGVFYDPYPYCYEPIVIVEDDDYYGY